MFFHAARTQLVDVDGALSEAFSEYQHLLLLLVDLLVSERVWYVARGLHLRHLVDLAERILDLVHKGLRVVHAIRAAGLHSLAHVLLTLEPGLVLFDYADRFR